MVVARQKKKQEQDFWCSVTENKNKMSIGFLVWVLGLGFWLSKTRTRTTVWVLMVTEQGFASYERSVEPDLEVGRPCVADHRRKKRTGTTNWMVTPTGWFTHKRVEDAAAISTVMATYEPETTFMCWLCLPQLQACERQTKV
ncbi:hypothetical protein HanIR_Chr02g0071091 [Helianthus annuus]|nr:hypothetical protein HanIR_Chr02g0071091 [Helianthus annuus]